MLPTISKPIQFCRLFSWKIAVDIPQWNCHIVSVQRWTSLTSVPPLQGRLNLDPLLGRELPLTYASICNLNSNSEVASDFPEKTPLVEELGNFRNGWGYDEMFYFFYRKRFSNFASFFLNSLIDVPNCFKVSTSLYRTQHNNFLHKLLSLNLQRGRLEKVNSLISQVLFALTWGETRFTNSRADPSFLNALVPQLRIANDLREGYQTVSGKLVTEGGDYPKLFLDEHAIKRLRQSIEGDIVQFSIQSRLTLPDVSGANNHVWQLDEGNREQRFRLYDQQREESTQWVLWLTEVSFPPLLLKYCHEFIRNGRMMDYGNRLVARFEKICQHINPVFTFCSYKTSKTIWKFSRGKAGRYFFMWKYVPMYKRELLILRWLKHEFFVAPAKQGKMRFEMGLDQLLAFDHNHPFAKRKRFANNFIFREYRFSLMRHFRTRK